MNHRKTIALLAAILLAVIWTGPVVFAAGADTTYLTPGLFTVDGSYLQEGMNAPYSQGYEPVVENGVLKVVLPLTASGKVEDSTIFCNLNLGVADVSPFIFKNYDSIAVHPRPQEPDGPEDAPDTYVASFELPLREDRKNGVYPLGVTIRYHTDRGEARQQFRIDFIIRDAAAPEPPPDNGLSAPDEPGYDPSDSDPAPVVIDSPGDAAGAGPATGGGSDSAGTVSEPKVILSQVVAAPSPCSAGASFTATCTLRNTSRKTTVRNMTVTYKSQSTDLIPEGGATTSYIESIGPDGTAQFAFSMRATETAASGPQKIDVALSYEGENGAAYTASDEITILVQQKIRLEHDQPMFPTQVIVGDTVSASLNLYNKGKGTLYNVTVQLDMPGLTPESSAFLGNMESGSSKTADIYAAVTGFDSADGLEYGLGAQPVNPDGALAAADVGPVDVLDEPAVIAEAAGADILDGAGGGPAHGNFIIAYEDEFGDVYEERIPVQTNIETMVNPGADFPGLDEELSQEPEPQGMPWWGWVLIAGGGAGGTAAAVHARRRKRTRLLAVEAADDDDLY